MVLTPIEPPEPVETGATRMCALLVGLPKPNVNVLAVDDTYPTSPLRVHVETTADIV